MDTNEMIPAPEGWTNDAACLNRPYEWFEIPDGLQSKASGTARKLLMKGQQICLSCQVSEQCEATAGEEEFKWTIRGGRWPTGLALTGQGNPKPMTPSVFVTGYCDRGHDRADVGVLSDGRCVACRENYRARDLERQRLAYHGLPTREDLSARVRAVWEYADQCPQGHDLGPVEDRTGPWCDTCPITPQELKLRKEATRRRNRRAAKKAAAQAIMCE